MRKVKKVICELCGQEISASNYSKHLRRHQNHPETFNEIYQLDHDNLFCKFCGKECKNKNSLVQHELRCKENPNRKAHTCENFNTKGHPAWNKGLTKETDERVVKHSISVSKAMQKKVREGYIPLCASDTYWTDEKKLEQSNRKKLLYQEHPEKHPNRKVASNKRRTYIEQVAYDWLTEHNIEFIEQYETIFYDGKRFVDFYLPDRNLYIELDGEYWHTDCKDKDERKDKYAKEVQNIDTVRISSKQLIIDVLEDTICGCGVVET